MSPRVPPLPPTIRQLLSDYIGEFQLKKLPGSFTQRNAPFLHQTPHGVPIRYMHRDSGETLKVETYPWKSASKLQSVVVASGKTLSEPVIIVPAQRGSTELRIWTGEDSNDQNEPGLIYKFFDRDKSSGPASGRPSTALITSGAKPVPNMPSRITEEEDITICRCKRPTVAEGEMVLCEECTTWQHILCYYPNGQVPAVHFCEECGSKYHDKKRAAKRQKIDPEAASPRHGSSDSTNRSVAETTLTRRAVAASPDLGVSAMQHVVATVGERELSSDDEPLISRSLNKNQDGGLAAPKGTETESYTTAAFGPHRQTTTIGTAASLPATQIDLTDDVEGRGVKVKTEPEHHSSTENPRTLLEGFMTPATSSSSSTSVFATPKPLITPTTTTTLTPNLTPQPPPSSRSTVGAKATPQLINNATTFVFFDSENNELRRRTFEDLGGRLNVGSLFGQAVRAGLISKSDSDAILLVTIRELNASFEILKDDKPDFARLMQSIEAAGLCTVEVRLS